MKFLTSRAGPQPRQNDGSNRFFLLRNVSIESSAHLVPIQRSSGVLSFSGEKKTEREPNDLAAPSSEAKKEIRISHYGD
jgi:hypothetical protein